MKRSGFILLSKEVEDYHVIGLILTRDTVIIPLIIIYTLIWVTVVWLIYIRRICRCSETEGAKL